MDVGKKAFSSKLWKVCFLLHSFTVNTDDMDILVHSSRFRVFEKSELEKPEGYCQLPKSQNYLFLMSILLRRVDIYFFFHHVVERKHFLQKTDFIWACHSLAWSDSKMLELKKDVIRESQLRKNVWLSEN